jgi:Flp pilus assembly protein TadG
MHARLLRNRRRAATLVESAFILPLAFFFILNLVAGGLLVYRYQLVAELAREGSRYASVHGSQYASDTGNAAATATDVSNAVQAFAAGLDTRQLSAAVSWNSSNKPGINTVTVTVTYQWQPLVFFGRIALTSSSTVQMQY